MQAYLKNPVLQNEQAASLNWHAPEGTTVTLSYAEGHQLVSKQLNTQGVESIGVFADTLFTLTVKKNEQTIQVQLSVTVIPTVNQFAKQNKYYGDNVQGCIPKLANRFELTALTTENVVSLGKALEFAGYNNGDIFQYIPAYFEQSGNKFTQPFLLALAKALQ